MSEDIDIIECIFLFFFVQTVDKRNRWTKTRRCEVEDTFVRIKHHPLYQGKEQNLQITNQA